MFKVEKEKRGELQTRVDEVIGENKRLLERSRFKEEEIESSKK